MPFFQTGNIKTYYELRGQGPAVVFIHGTAASHDMWFPQMDYFSKTYAVLAYDIRGHQQSGGSDDKYTCALFAEDLHSLLQGLDIGEPVICGVSLGGMIAEEYAVKYQTEIHGLVLVDTAALSELTLSDENLRASWKSSKRMLEELVKRKRPWSYTDLFTQYFTIAPETRTYLKREQMKMDRLELLKLIDCIYSFRLPALRKIRVPTLVMVGENERKVVLDHAEVALKTIPGSRKVVIPGAGHLSNLENPEVFNRELDDFLRGLVISSI